MNSFRDDSVSNEFVNNNTNTSGINVKYFSGTSLIEFEWHSLSIILYINYFHIKLMKYSIMQFKNLFTLCYDPSTTTST